MKKIFALALFVLFIACSKEAEKGPSIHFLPDDNILWEKTPEGLEYYIVQKGNGDAVKSDSRLEVEYTGWYFDTKEKYASSKDRNKPFRVKLNTPLTMKGWDIGLTKLNYGGKIYLKIPPNLAYKKTPRDVRENVDFVFGIYILP